MGGGCRVFLDCVSARLAIEWRRNGRFYTRGGVSALYQALHREISPRRSKTAIGQRAAV
jgi:hypothetical protein